MEVAVSRGGIASRRKSLPGGGEREVEDPVGKGPALGD